MTHKTHSISFHLESCLADLDSAKGWLFRDIQPVFSKAETLGQPKLLWLFNGSKPSNSTWSMGLHSEVSNLISEHSVDRNIEIISLLCVMAFTAHKFLNS